MNMTVRLTPEQIKQAVLKVLDERIIRATNALPLCKHTKRKHRLIKLLKALEEAREQFGEDSLPTRLEGSD